MKKALHILLALLVLASAAGVATAQVQQQKCPTCGKPYSECPYHNQHPKCSTCGKVIDKCQYNGKHPAKCKTCGKTVDQCQYGGNHPAKCKTCGKTVDQCQYGGNHPAKCKTCGKTVDLCQYGGNHPAKCKMCGKTVDLCQYGGNHPKCLTCGKIIDNCRYGGYHPKCSTCGKIIDDCQYGGNHPKCSTCGEFIENCQYGGNHPSEQELLRERVFSELERNMVLVVGGTFKMGATQEQGSEAFNEEKPVHQVTLSSFYICKYEVTQELWRAVMGSNPSYFKLDQHPVENVSWEDCQEFIHKLNQLTGKQYRLPTEAEWEYAARGGNRPHGSKYADYGEVESVAWYKDNSGNTTHPVGTKSSNNLGLYNMSGNVWEWCQDWYGRYGSKSQTDPTGPSKGTDRVFRGGCWANSAGGCRLSNRNYGAPSSKNNGVGLRLAANFPQ